MAGTERTVDERPTTAVYSVHLNRWTDWSDATGQELPLALLAVR
mgnify:FL=1